jgi:hypothetical protein
LTELNIIELDRIESEEVEHEVVEHLNVERLWDEKTAYKAEQVLKRARFRIVTRLFIEQLTELRKAWAAEERKNSNYW